MLVRQTLRGICLLALNGVLAHIIGEAMPREWFHFNRFPFRTVGWEQNGRVYDRLNISHWKDVLPDMSRILPDMYPKRLTGRPDAEQFLRLIQETCVAEIVHLVLLFLSPLFLWYIDGGLGIIFMILNIAGNLPFILIQRYNRPRLTRIYRRLCRSAEKHPLEEPLYEATDPNLQYRGRT